MADMTKIKTFLTAAICRWQVNNCLMGLRFLGQFWTMCKYGQSPYHGTAMACFGALLVEYGDYEWGIVFGKWA